MKNYYLNLFLCFQAFVLLNYESNFTESNRIVDVILPSLSLSGYAIPLESLFISLFACFIVYLVIEYNSRLLFREKFKLAINILHRTYTPLTLLHHQLEHFVAGNFSDLTSRKLKQMLEFANCIIDGNLNVMALDKANLKIQPDTSSVKFELYTYIISIANLCRPYAKFREVQLEVYECSEYINCRINETIMTAALQHLLNKMIEISTFGSHVHVYVSHTEDSWQLHISNFEKVTNKMVRMFPFIPAVFPIHGGNDLRTVRKIIRLHDGKINAYKNGKDVAFQIIVPIDCQCSDSVDTSENPFVSNRKVCSQKEPPISDTEKHVGGRVAHPHIMLVMSDRLFSEYQNKMLSEYFEVSILENPDLIINASVIQKPDVIIIDENVNGKNASEICLRIKTNKVIANIPVIILISGRDNESYLFHAECGANRLEPRTVSICKLKVDITMLIGNHLTLLERIKPLPISTFPIVVSDEQVKTDKNLLFINKINVILDKNLAMEHYTVKMLCSEIGMSATSLFNKMKEVTGQSPEKYIVSYKMEKAAQLLASREYNVTEISSMLGFCDAKYFGKRFKMYYKVCPTKYIASRMG